MTKKQPMETKFQLTTALHKETSKTSHYPHHHHLLEEIATGSPTWVMDQCISPYTRVMNILDDIGSSMTPNGGKLGYS